LDLLVYERALGLIPDLLAETPDIRPVVMRADGTVRAAGSELDPEAIDPDIAWASTDLLTDEAAPLRPFMVRLLKSTRTRWVQSGAAGLDHPIWRQLADKGIRISRSDATAVAIAEYVLTAALETHQPLAERREAQARGAWERLPFREIHGSRWLILGMGAIGREVARRAGAFGVHLTGVRREPRRDEPVDRTIAAGELRSALPEADVVVLAMPETDATRGLVDETFVGAMKPGALLINVARGGLIDETALLRGLDAGTPGAAVLDVFASEPLPGDSPFWDHPCVRVTAHCAAYSEGTRRRGAELFAVNLRRYRAGEALRLEVDAAMLREQGGEG